MEYINLNMEQFMNRGEKFEWKNNKCGGASKIEIDIMAELIIRLRPKSFSELAWILSIER